MEFLIADTFTDSLARLTNAEQKVVKTTAFDLQVIPANPGIQFHKTERDRDSNFWSARVMTVLPQDPSDEPASSCMNGSQDRQNQRGTGLNRPQ
ncbi:MAG: hypothetical protein O3B01_00225 [Planctomycetota bacterium]|nr:hypothetical protein [Planctomycetota bacterium]